MNSLMGLRTCAKVTLAAGMVVGVASAASAQFSTSADGRVTAFAPSDTRAAMTAADRAKAKSRLPMLTDLGQVPGMGGVTSQGYGSGRHPFTTKAAYTSSTSGHSTQVAPLRSTGKLWMRKGSSWFVCTASVINKGLLVTAAHCVWDYGRGPLDQVMFEPARHGTVAPHALPYGRWTASAWIVPSVYANGTDTCTVAGIVCANDVAIVVLNTGPSPYAGRDIAQVVGRYGYYTNQSGYISFLGKVATQITQLGYPVRFDEGYKMIRTDSLGYQADPFNVIIGSDQTGGSSGGPWIQNFGINPVSTSSVPSFNSANQVVATTSWGYTDSRVKVIGASRFGHNPAFPASGSTNIHALLAQACRSYPTKCYW